MPIELELAGANAKKKAGGCGCGCSGHEPEELIAADLPRVLRHGAIIGGITSMRPEREVVVVFDHDPKPLLMQLERTAPGAVEVSYLAQGPQTWRVNFRRR